MRCPKCSAEDPEGAKFCIGYASPMAAKCPRCGADNKPQAKFCNDCGALLNPSTPGAAAVESRPDIKRDAKDDIAGGRRHLTVLFCDLLGSTEISSHLDPEQWREIVGEYHRATAHAIERFGGYVAQYLGDGVMAYFGYPRVMTTTPNVLPAPALRSWRQ
jgi:hypothetical protein